VKKCIKKAKMATKPAISKPKNAVFDPKREIISLLNQ